MKTTNTLGALLALSILGCSSEPVPLDVDASSACTPGESRACTCATGAAGAQVCEAGGAELGPCVCAVDDGGFEALDAGVIFEVDAGGRDAGAPVARDAGHDGGALDAGPAWEGECDLVTQEGCKHPYSCRRTPDNSFPPRGAPRCEPTYGNHIPWIDYGGCTEERHGEQVDMCRRGSRCMSFGVCAVFCDPAGAACPAAWDGSPTWCNCDPAAGLDCFCTPAPMP